MNIFFSIWSLPLLAAAVVVFWCLPERYRTSFMTLASAAVLGVIQPAFTVLLFVALLAVYAAANAILKVRTSGAFVAAVVGLVLFLLAGRYGPGIAEDISKRFGFFAGLVVPLGISYLSFKLIAYVFDVYRGEITELSLLNLAAFIFFLPTFPAGPIVRYQEFIGHRASHITRDDITAGLARLTFGYFRKIILAQAVGVFLFNDTYDLVMMKGGDLSTVAGWPILLFLFLSLVYAYFDLAAYADLAIGAGRLFGYRIMENMNNPLIRPNIGEYWRCWHISLSSWCRNNVYMPMLGKYRKPTLALYSSFFVMGLWHEVSLTWLAWGGWHASGIYVYGRWNRSDACKRINAALGAHLQYAAGVFLTVSFSALGFAFIMSPNIIRAFEVLLACIGI